jgi:hypothetical protein
MIMFAFPRSAFAVLAPLALLLAVVLVSRQSGVPDASQQAQVGQEQGGDRVAATESRDQTVAANFPSR